MDNQSPFAHVGRPREAQRLTRLSAFTIWFMVGPFGAHRFYAGKPWSGALMLVCTLLSAAAMFAVSFTAGQLALTAVTLWWAVDGLLILRWIPDAAAVRELDGEFGKARPEAPGS